jgi:hypothetical protein
MVVVENLRVCYEINEENRGDESKHSDSKSSNVDNFYSLYHSKLTLRNRREKLQSQKVIIP